MVRLQYTCETQNSCSCENSNAVKAKLKKFYLLTLILLIKKCNFLTLTSYYGKFNQENMYQTLSDKHIQTHLDVFGAQF